MNWKFLHHGTAPLRQPEFRDLWIANFVSNLGTIMHGAAAAWMMTSLTTSPLLIGLVQTAASAPAFLLGVAGGTLTDLIDRRRLLTVAQLWMMTTAALMAAAAWSGHLRPWSLLMLLLLLGLGSAIHLPGWQTLLQDLVSRDRMAAAVSLNSISFNLARALGPALGGFLVGAVGAACVFGLNALSFLVVLGALARIPPSMIRDAGGRATPRAMFRSLSEGLRFLRDSPMIPGVLIRTSWFMVTGSGIWALLPLVAKVRLATDATGYGLLLSAFGAGSVAGAVVIPSLRRRFPLDPMVGLCLLLFSGCVVITGLSKSLPLAAGAMLFAGLFWIMVAVNHNVAVQANSPDWVRGRTISFYLITFQGSLALGSWLAGWVASLAGVGSAVVLCGVLSAMGILLIPLFPLAGRKSDPARTPGPS